MKKIASLLFICLLVGCVNTQAIIITPESVKHSNVTTTMPYQNYLKYYIIDNGQINLTFKQLPADAEKDFEKKLSKEEKQDYKYVKKIQKLIDKGAWGEALYKYYNFYPAQVQYYRNCINKKEYSEALRTLEQIRNMDKYYQIYSVDLINQNFAFLYMKSGQYQNALQYYKIFEDKGKDSTFSSIANCYYNLGDLDNAILYIRKIKQLSYEDKELIYSIKLKQNNIKEAHKWALELTNQKYNFSNLMKVQTTSPNDTEKLKYCYQARNTTNNENEIIEVNRIIAELEQKKLDKQLSTLKQFIKIQKWSEIEKQIPPNITINEKTAKQDEYFKTAQNYLIRYEGQQLTNAFNSLNQDFVNYIISKQNEYYQEQAALAQQALLEAQQQQAIIQQQQLIEQQQIQRYHNLNRIYYLSNPRYFMEPYDFWY